MQFTGLISVAPMAGNITINTPRTPHQLSISATPLLLHCGGNSVGVELVEIGNDGFTIYVRSDTTAEIHWSYNG